MTSCQFYKAVELSYHPSLNMIGKFLFFGILISAPLAITGLKCYQGIDQAGNAALIECTAPDDFVCGIAVSEIGGGVSKTCASKKSYDDLTYLGCKSEGGATQCLCQTDGYNYKC